MAKNIVICCDGTGNEFGESKSNVVKLYKMLVHDGRRSPTTILEWARWEPAALSLKQLLYLLTDIYCALPSSGAVTRVSGLRG